MILEQHVVEGAAVVNHLYNNAGYPENVKECSFAMPRHDRFSLIHQSIYIILRLTCCSALRQMPLMIVASSGVLTLHPFSREQPARWGYQGFVVSSLISKFVWDLFDAAENWCIARYTMFFSRE